MSDPSQKIREQNSSRVTRLEWYILILVCAAAVLSYLALDARAVDDKYLRVYFLDVGQGDAIFIQNFNQNQVLIDGGPDGKVIEELSRIMPFGDRSINMTVLTHPHADHVVGLIEVLKRYNVGKVLENAYEYDTPEYGEWNRLKHEAQVFQAVAGQVVDLGGGVRLEVVYPDVDDSGKKISNPNNASIVMRLRYGMESVLLTGDIEATIEKKLALNGSEIDSDFLKVGHHGSKTSSTEEFIQAVSPIDAFIEVGAKNNFGHPSPEVLARLENHGIKYYRTDRDGTVELILDGQSFSIKEDI